MIHKNYTQISNELLLNDSIHPLAKVVFSVLCTFAQRDKNRVCRISLAKISKFTKTGVKTVRKLRDILIELGFIDVIEPEKGRCHSYKVYFHSKFSNTTFPALSVLPSTSLEYPQLPPNNMNIENNIEDQFLKEQQEWNLLQQQA
jgi:hypothetical protein